MHRWPQPTANFFSLKTKQSIKKLSKQSQRAELSRSPSTIGAPFDASGRSVDTEDDELGFPHFAVVAPHVGVLVGATGDDTIGLGRPVDAEHFERVFAERLCQSPVGATFDKYHHILGIGRHGDL